MSQTVRHFQTVNANSGGVILCAFSVLKDALLKRRFARQENEALLSDDRNGEHENILDRIAGEIF